MSQIYWNLHEIPRPEGSYINHNDGRVFLITDTGDGRKKRQVIGRATSETMMHPNDLFRYLFPAQWEQAYGQVKVSQHMLCAGMYAASLAIGYESGLYPILQKAYGPLHANMVMDYANYSILERSDVSQHYEECMGHEVLFSKDLHGDSWISDFFRTGMTEDQNHLFRTMWLEECRKRGVTKAWISIDGSNSNCQAEESDLSQKGSAKSHLNVGLVSYIYAVSAEDALPLVYFASDGSVVDCKAFQKVAELLKGAGIETEGVILDRGFCTHDVVSKLEECGYDYVLMLPSHTSGHTAMMKDHMSRIRWNVRHVAGEDGLFAIQERKKLFKSHGDEAFISLFFDGTSGSERAVALIRKVMSAARTMQKQLDSGERPSVPAGLEEMLCVTTDGSGRPKVEVMYDNWQKAVDAKGFASIASSREMSVQDVYRIYHLRDVSEKQFAVLKTQLGYNVLRVHFTEGIENKLAVCFVASIIRSLLASACRRQGLETTRMIRELDRISLMLMPNGSYVAIDNLTTRQKKLLSEFNLGFSDFKFIATDVNRRLSSPVNSQVRTLQEKEPEPKRRGRPPKMKEEPVQDVPKRGPGRPRGSRNRKTILREAEQAAREAETSTSTEEPKRRRGRPVGSKNKKTLLQEAGLSAVPKQEAKRGRGRPRGSKNKPKPKPKQ